MKKYKELFNNLGLLTISNFGSKILTFLLVPLYTNILTTGEYGIYDLYITTTLLLSPVFSLNIADAVMRFALEKGKNQRDVFTVGFIRIITATIIFAVIVAFNYTFNIIPVFNQFPFFLWFYFTLSLTYDFLTQFTRGMDKISDLAIAGLINSATMVTLNILFLLVIKIGLTGYFLANCLAFFVPIIYLTLRLKTYKMLNIKFKDKPLKKEMERYSTPIIFNTISWWINNVSDRYIITWILGIEANGIYSVAYKIPSVLNVFQSIFSQAWTISAIKEFDDENKKFYSAIYKMYNFLMVFVCSALLLFNQLIAKILFAKEFYEAWKYAPFLLISVVFGSLSGFLGGIFSAAKKSTTFAKTTIVGAVINIVLNIALVEKIGAIGAAIATLISYFVVWASRFYQANKIIKIEINLKRDFISYLILLAQAIIMVLVSNYIIKYISIIVLLIILILINLSEFKALINKVTKAFNIFKKNAN